MKLISKKFHVAIIKLYCFIVELFCTEGFLSYTYSIVLHQVQAEGKTKE